MMAESIVSISPIALLQHWITTLRRAMSTDKHGIGSAEIEHVDRSKHHHKGTVNTLLVVACIVFGAASFMFGYDDKVISPIIALPAFVETFQGGDQTAGSLVLTARNQNLVISVPLVGDVIGSLFAPSLTFHLGRKWPLVASYTLSLGGSLLQVFAPNLGAFVAGRALNGVAIGIAIATAPLYLSEVVPASIRGRCVSSINILNLIAGVIGTVVVWGTKKIGGHPSFQIPLAIQCAIPVILVILTLPLPESPEWLVSKGNMEQARHNLRKLRGFSDEQVDEELHLMELCEKNNRELRSNVQFWHIFRRDHLRRTLVAGSFYSLNQISGVILSTTYTTVFLTEIGAANAFTLTIIASCCTLAGTLAAPLVIDRAGRRPTAFVGMSILFVIDVIAGGLAFDTKSQNSTVAIAALGFIFNFFWASSFYSLSNVMPSEMATAKLRHYVMSYTIACQGVTAVITTLVVPQLTSTDAANLGAKTYLVFAGCMAAIIVFVYFFMPETRGRTFVEIDEIYAAKVPAWKWRSYQTTLEARTGVSNISTEKIL
ncbi:uncharacterized protein N7484_001676 [Penicillium longicatenatum]|uniref:uncharacterized protein n=1 Tax=Penicillium longicatenatum TaxID=1561947 RepID=UPI002546657D|nr:uncharacterized protein N7484_001676 [Penicillium longicatenatum]KAJ5658027.1 hypothetical protein N7484_001676 [Penicillium longicatenatum]